MIEKVQGGNNGGSEGDSECGAGDCGGDIDWEQVMVMIVSVAQLIMMMMVVVVIVSVKQTSR